MSDWPLYESHKVVRANRIVEIGFVGNTTEKLLLIQVDPEGYESFEPTVQAMKERANVGDYAVIYEDGFRSVSPAKAFEEGYTKLPADLDEPIQVPSLRSRIENAINCSSAENGSNTPDFILARFLTECLAAFDGAVHARETWYGRNPDVGPGGIPTAGSIPLGPPTGPAPSE